MKKPNDKIVSVSIGINLAVGMFGCIWVGTWIDKKTGWGPYGALGGAVLGLLYCAYEVWKLIRKLNNNDEH